VALDWSKNRQFAAALRIVSSGSALHFSEGEGSVTVASEIITQFNEDAFTENHF